MTLGEGKEKVYKLIDEYSSSGAVTRDEDIEKKMAAFFDIAQKDVAKKQRIIKSVTLPVVDENGKESWEMPKDFLAPLRYWLNGRITRRSYLFHKRELVAVGDEKELEVEYFAIPETIDGNTPDTHEFEVGEDGAQAMCYYVAAQQLYLDQMVDYTIFYQEYLRHLATLDDTVPVQHTVVNSLWR